MRIPQISLQGRRRAASELSEELGRGFAEFGFVGVQDHGIDPDLIDGVYHQVREFFALPDEEKQRYCVEGGAGQRGYTPFGKETGKDASQPDLKEFWHVGREEPPAAGRADGLGAYPPNLWPEELPEFRASLLRLFEDLDRLGRHVLRGLACWLGQDEAFFEDKVQSGNSILRPLHYPPIEGAAGGVRAAAHEDINVITLLVGSHEPGLQILARSGEWLPVTSIEGTIVCNVGDMLQRLTNHRLPSTTHRVVNPPAPWSERSRYSIPFFQHFNADYQIEALASCVTEGGRVADPPITAHAYLQERLCELGLLEDQRGEEHQGDDRNSSRT